MREQINMEDLEQVNGGVVFLSKDWMKIGFSNLKQTYSLKNCSYGQAFALVDAIYEQYKDKSAAFVEEKTKEAFESKGWI